MPNRPKTNRLTVFFIILVFVLPIIAAIGLYLFGHKPGVNLSQVNQGQLLQLPLPIQEWQLLTYPQGQPLEETLHGKWTLLYFAALPCSQTCQGELIKMRQIHSALGKDQTRLQRVWVILANDELPNFNAEPYADLILATSGQEALVHFFGDQLPIDGIEAGFYCVIDPLGNLVTVYPHDTPPRSIYKDLNRLLSVSTIG